MDKSYGLICASKVFVFLNPFYRHEKKMRKENRSKNSAKFLILCFTEEIQSHWFGVTCG